MCRTVRPVDSLLNWIARLGETTMKTKNIVWIGAIITIVVLVLVFQASGKLPFLNDFLDNINPFKPKEQITIDVIITDIERVSKLVTTSYTIQQVDERSGSTWKIIMVEKGTVKAGINLDQLGPSNVTISEENKSITIRLPPASILTEKDYILSSDANETYVFDRIGVYVNLECGLKCFDAEETQMRDEAGNRILETACKEGILGDATKDARDAVEQFFNLSAPDYQVTVISAPVPSDCVAK